MSIWVGKETRLLVQGLTGRERGSAAGIDAAAHHDIARNKAVEGLREGRNAKAKSAECPEYPHDLS